MPARCRHSGLRPDQYLLRRPECHDACLQPRQRDSRNFFTNGGTRNTDVGDGEIKGVPQTTDTAFLLGIVQDSPIMCALTAQFNFGYTSFLQNSYDRYSIRQRQSGDHLLR